MKLSKILIIVGVFIALLVAVVYFGRDLLPKTHKLHLTIEDCSFSLDRNAPVPRNENVSLTISSDQDGKFTIPAFSIDTDVKADQDKTVVFKTVRSGIFDIELSDCADHTMITVLNEDGSAPDPSSHDHSDDEATDHSHDDNEATDPSSDDTEKEGSDLPETNAPSDNHDHSHEHGHSH